MLRRGVLSCVAVVILTAAVAWSGDVSGKWTAEFTTPRGDTRENTFVFVVDGGVLTGTVSGPRGESEIEEGKLDGEEISFSVTRDFARGAMTLLYKGTLTGDEIEMEVTVERFGRTFEMTAKRVVE